MKRTVFYWRLKAWTTNSRLSVYSSNSGTPLHVTLLKWIDHRAMYPLLMPNEPLIMGPSFTRRAIEFGLQHGWDADERGAPFNVHWDGEAFQIPARSSDTLVI